MGYWDANPATRGPLSPKDSAPLYVEMMGGAQKILEKGKELYNQSKYRHVMEILNKLVYAEPDNVAAKDMFADAFEQFGYQKESPSLRNSFLAAANELRSGIPSDVPGITCAPDMIRALPTGMWLDFMAIRLDSKKAENKAFKINLITPDNNENFLVELSNATLTSIEGFQAKDADLTITINRSDLEKTLMGAVSFGEQIRLGNAKLKGNPKVLEQLKTVLVHFDLGFEMLPGTGAKDLTPEQNPFEQEHFADTAGG